MTDTRDLLYIALAFLMLSIGMISGYKIKAAEANLPTYEVQDSIRENY